MQRAPEVSMTEREFRREKRRQLNKIVAAMNRFGQHANLLPDNSKRRITSIAKSIDSLHGDLIPWWDQY